MRVNITTHKHITPTKVHAPYWWCVEVSSLEMAMVMDCGGTVTEEEFASPECRDELGITLTEYGASMKKDWVHVEFTIMPDDTPIVMSHQPLH